MLALKDQPTTETETAMDRRRVSELDADFTRLHRAMAKSLTQSVRTYAGELKAGTPAHIAAKAFVQRHTHLLSTAYDLAHYEGQRDYHETVSARPKEMPLVEPDATLKARRLAFYLPSVTKMAREGAEAQRERRLSPVTAMLDEADGYNTNVMLATVPTGDALDDWLDGLGVRVDLQAGIAWPGMQDGYVKGGAADTANPYSLVYWILEPLAQHCHDCPAFAAASPYNAPGSGGNELWIAPGDGTSECGAGCRCSLSYEPDTSDEARSAAYWTDQYSKWLPQGMPASFAGEGGREVLLQTFQPRLQAQPGPLTDGQKRALDSLRGAMADWDKVRGAYPSAPNFFAGTLGADQTAAYSIPVDWAQLSKAQQRVLLRVLAALDTWDFWTHQAMLDGIEWELSEDNEGGLSRVITLSNPYERQAHGRFGFGGMHGMHSHVGSGLRGHGEAHGHEPVHHTGPHAGERVAARHTGSRRSGHKSEHDIAEQPTRRLRRPQPSPKAEKAERTPETIRAHRDHVRALETEHNRVHEEHAVAERSAVAHLRGVRDAAKAHGNDLEHPSVKPLMREAAAKDQHARGLRVQRDETARALENARADLARAEAAHGRAAGRDERVPEDLGKRPNLGKRPAEHPMESRFDEHGQEMPFTRGDFVHAWAGKQAFSNENINPVYTIEINGRRYVAKEANAQLVSQYDQQRNEAATVAGMKALGLCEHAPSEAYHIGINGQSYAVISHEEGSGKNLGREAFVAGVVSNEAAQRSLLGSYVLGMSDRHANNLIVDAAHESMRQIDFGFGFRHDTKMPIGKNAALHVLAWQSGQRPEGFFTKWERVGLDREELGRVISHKADLFKALQPYHLSERETKALQDRFTVLEKLYNRGKQKSGATIAEILKKGGADVDE